MHCHLSPPRTIGLILMSCRRCSGWWCCGVGSHDDADDADAGDGDGGSNCIAAVVAAVDAGPGSLSDCRLIAHLDWPPDPVERCHR